MSDNVILDFADKEAIFTGNFMFTPLENSPPFAG